MKIAISELIVKYLEKLGVEVVCGMPGAHILPVYDSLYDSTVKTVLVKHEQGAAFMAGGYARASGKVSACITTAGPGATNLVKAWLGGHANRFRCRAGSRGKSVARRPGRETDRDVKT